MEIVMNIIKPGYELLLRLITGQRFVSLKKSDVYVIKARIVLPMIPPLPLYPEL